MYLVSLRLQTTAAETTTTAAAIHTLQVQNIQLRTPRILSTHTLTHTTLTPSPNC